MSFLQIFVDKKSTCLVFLFHEQILYVFSKLLFLSNFNHKLKTDMFSFPHGSTGCGICIWTTFRGPCEARVKIFWLFLFLSWNYTWKNAWKLFLLYISTSGLHHSLQSPLDIFTNVSQVLIFIRVSLIFCLLLLTFLGVLWIRGHPDMVHFKLNSFYDTFLMDEIIKIGWNSAELISATIWE